MKRYDLELTATGPVMEERKEGAFVPFSEVEQLQAKIFWLLEERNSTGIAISNAIRSGILPDKHPLKSRLELLANHHEREMDLAAQLSDATRQCGVMADLVNRMVTMMVMAGDEAESGSCNPVKAWMFEAQEALAGKLPYPAMTVTETIRTAPERIWLQVGDMPGDSDHPFPDDHEGVSWCDERVMPCKVPYVRADLVGKVPDNTEQPLAMVQEGWLLSTLPQASESQRKGGWTLSFEFLDSVTDEVVIRHGYGASMEAVEAVLQVVDAMLAAAPKPDGEPCTS